jgi:hypothetical protein
MSEVIQYGGQGASNVVHYVKEREGVELANHSLNNCGPEHQFYLNLGSISSAFVPDRYD